MFGSVIFIVIGEVEFGDVPSGASHDTAIDATYDFPGGTWAVSAAVCVTG